MVDSMEGIEPGENVNEDFREDPRSNESQLSERRLPNCEEIPQNSENDETPGRQTNALQRLARDQKTVDHGQEQSNSLEERNPISDWTLIMTADWVLLQIRSILARQTLSQVPEVWPDELALLQKYQVDMATENERLGKENNALREQLAAETASKSTWMSHALLYEEKAEDIVRESDDLLETLASDNSKLQAELSATRKKVADLQVKLSETEIQIIRQATRWEGRIEEHKNEVAKLTGKLKTEEEKSNSLLTSMAGMKSADRFKIDDSELKEQTCGLRELIKTWVENVALQLPASGFQRLNRSKGSIDTADPRWSFFHRVTPMFEDYVARPEDHKLLLESYLWRHIKHWIFTNDYWAGAWMEGPRGETSKSRELSREFHMMKVNLGVCSSTKAEIIEYHQWRSTSARVLVPKISKEWRNFTITDLLERFVKNLLPMVKSRQDLEISDLEQIIETAIDLAQTVAQQRTNIELCFTPVAEYGRHPFDSKIMSDVTSSNPRQEPRIVILTLAPRLRKYGTSEGKNYDIYTDLLREEVETRIVKK